jgi:hypothetical protein
MCENPPIIGLLTLIAEASSSQTGVCSLPFQAPRPGRD